MTPCEITFLSLLLRLEWQGDTVHFICPLCRMGRQHGHKPSCEVQQWIVELSDEKAEQMKTPCPTCGKHTDEVWTIQVSRQTHWEPAEYEKYCKQCLPQKYQERDPDEERERRRDRDDHNE